MCEGDSMKKNYYSFSESISTAWSLLLTKLAYPQARLIRRPVFVRGKRSIVGAEGLTTGHACRFDLNGDSKTLFIGSNCEMGDNVHIVAHKNVTIGNNVLMASKVFISDTNHGVYKGEYQDIPDSIPKERLLVSSPVIIGDNVWIGENVVILAGSEIGSGCIIGANSVVSGFVNKNTIAVGAPAREIKRFEYSENIWKKTKGTN